MDNRVASLAVGVGPTFALAELSFSGDTTVLPLGANGILSGSEGAWTYTLYVGGAGAVTAGVQRMTLASDDPAVVALQILDDWDESDRAKVNPIVGSAGVAGGSGVVGATTQRMVLATDVALPAGTNAIGKLAANTGVDIGDVDVTSIAAGDNNIGNVDIVTVPTDPFGANADAASATGSISAKLRFIASTGIPITGTVTVGSHAVTNAGTFVVQLDGAGLTALQLLDNIVLAEDAAHVTGDPGVMALTVRSNTAASTSGLDGDYQPLITNTTGCLWVDASGQTLTVASHAVTNAGTFAVQAVCTNAGTFAVQSTIAAAATNIAKAEDVASANADVGVPAMAVQKATPANTAGTDGDYEFLQMSAGRVWASATIDAALPAGANAIGKLAANAGVTIGAVEIAAAQTLATVTTVGTVTTVSTVTTCSTVTTVSTLTGSGVAHDGVDSGNPHKIGTKATTSLSGKTMVADNDRTDLFSGADGVLIARLHSNLEDVVQERTTNTDGASTAFASGLAAPGAGIRLWVTNVTIANSSASFCTVDLRDGAAGAVLWTIPVPATGGAIARFDPPLKLTANTALAFDASAATTTLSISANGFKSKL